MLILYALISFTVCSSNALAFVLHVSEVFYSLLEGISIGRSVAKLAFFVGSLLGWIKLPTDFATFSTLGADNCCYNEH